MKFKYKKIIIMITMCTMCIGVVTISLSTPKESTKKVSTENLETSDKNQPTAQVTQSAKNSKDSKSKLTRNGNKKINTLVNAYLDATLKCDMEELEKLVTQISNIKEAELKVKQSMMEEYQNVECYTIDGVNKGEYLVYVYWEIKFKDVDTAPPGLMRYYVVTDSSGALKIENGLVQQEVQDYIKKMDDSAEVKEMAEKVNYNFEEAISKDENLRELYSKLNGGSDEVKQDSSSTNESSEKTETEKE